MRFKLCNSVSARSLIHTSASFLYDTKESCFLNMQALVVGYPARHDSYQQAVGWHDPFGSCKNDTDVCLHTPNRT